MIIKKIVITNFRSYYGENTFELSKGLTLIIGGNAMVRQLSLKLWSGC